MAVCVCVVDTCLFHCNWDRVADPHSYIRSCGAFVVHMTGVNVMLSLLFLAHYSL